MTREETKMLLMRIAALYPGFEDKLTPFTIDVWFEELADFDYSNVLVSLKTYLRSEKASFVPKVGDLLMTLADVKEKIAGDELDEMEAWSMVYKAICDSTYNSIKRFNELPKNVQKAVGTPENLRAWAMDEGFNQNVTQSLFIRNYREVCKRAKEVSVLPNSVKELFAQANNKLLEDGNGQEEA